MVVGVEVGVGEKGLLGQSARAWALTVELNLDPPWQAQISNSRRFDSFGLYNLSPESAGLCEKPFRYALVGAGFPPVTVQ